MEAIGVGDRWYELCQDRKEWFRLCSEGMEKVTRQKSTCSATINLSQEDSTAPVGGAFVDREI